jgi:hypothetical protein
LGCNTLGHGNNARNRSVQLSLSQLARCFVFLIIAYVFSSTKLEKRAEQVLPGREVMRGRVKGRNDLNNVCIYKYMNKEKNVKKKKIWYLCTMEFYSATKKNENLSYAGKWMQLENIILTDVHQVQKDKSHMFLSYM